MYQIAFIDDQSEVQLQELWYIKSDLQLCEDQIRNWFRLELLEWISCGC